MRKIIACLVSTLCVSVLFSYNSGSNQPDFLDSENVAESKMDEPLKIQSKFFGLELGKSSLQETMTVVKESDWRFMTFEDAIIVSSPILFGDTAWDGITFSFKRGILASIMLSEDLDKYDTSEKKSKFDKLANQLKEKYNKLLSKECNDDYILASDDIIQVSLGHESDGTDDILIFEYCIKEDKINNIAPSEI